MAKQKKYKTLQELTDLNKLFKTYSPREYKNTDITYYTNLKITKQDNIPVPQVRPRNPRKQIETKEPTFKEKVANFWKQTKAQNSEEKPTKVLASDKDLGELADNLTDVEKEAARDIVTRMKNLELDNEKPEYQTEKTDLIVKKEYNQHVLDYQREQFKIQRVKKEDKISQRFGKLEFE